MASVATHAVSAVTSEATHAASVVRTEAPHIASVVKTEATHIASTVKSVATKAASSISSAASVIASEAAKIDHFDAHKTHNEIPLRLNNNFTLLDTTIRCHNYKNQLDAHIKIDIAAKMDMKMDFGYVLKGQLLPPKLDDVSDLLSSIFAHLLISINNNRFRFSPVRYSVGSCWL